MKVHQLQKLIMVQHPYNVLENIRVENDCVVAEASLNTSPRPGQTGTFSAGENIRHAAIAASMAAARRNPVKEPHYYLSIQGWGEENENNTFPHDIKRLRIVASVDSDTVFPTSLDESARITGSSDLYDADTDLYIATINVVFLMIHHSRFGRFMNAAPDEPKPMEVREPWVTITNTERIDEYVSVGYIPPVQAEQCQGHFHEYLRLPVAAMFTSLFDMVALYLDADETFNIVACKSSIPMMLSIGESARVMIKQMGNPFQYQIQAFTDDESQKEILNIQITIRRYKNGQEMELQQPVPVQHPTLSTITRDVSIIGIGCMLPGSCNSPQELWELLQAKESGIINLPESKWNPDAFASVDQQSSTNTAKGGFLQNVKEFDPLEFGISPNEAKAMDPTHRLLLEVTRSALEDAGISYRGTETGVYVGSTAAEYLTIQNSHPAVSRGYALTGSHQCMPANRISNVFDLTGPSFNVDTACASSLTAVHLAIQAIRAGECDQAVVAGANLILSPISTIIFASIGAISKSGKLSAFDLQADGTLRGEGIGVLVIKRSDLAQQDGDHLYATICGSAINSNGQGTSLTTPSAKQQQQVIQEAYQDANVKPQEAFYVELHGTGTKVGDRIEGNAAGEIFSKDRKFKDVGPVRIGSIKTNLGHLEAAAGMASLIKVALMMDRGCLLPSVNFEHPNPAIQWKEHHLHFQTEIEPLPPVDGIIMSVSGYGIGGANSHVVLRKPIQTSKEPLDDNDTAYQIFFIGCESSQAIEKSIALWKNVSTTDKSIAAVDFAALMANRASNYPWRSFAIAKSLKEAEFSAPVRAPTNHKAVFVFGGQGPQYTKMGKQLYQSSAV